MKKFTAVALLVAMLLACLSPCMAAEKEPVYVCFGDSVVLGYVEDEESYPEYDWDTGSFTGQFATYLGTTRINYGRAGMQTTDVLYMLDNEFRAKVDSGELSFDSWHTDEYPPYDGTSLETVINDTKRADYISLFVGSCDYVSYPGELRSQRLDEIEDATEARELVDQAFEEGTMDAETYAAMKLILQIDGENAKVYTQFVLDIVKGYSEFATYYPQIVAKLRELNPDATIFCIGNYIPGDAVKELIETETSSTAVKALNRLLDRTNWVFKKAAVTYDCLYVDTMGIDSKWHPTPTGHKQICERMISVLKGEDTYAGDIENYTENEAKVKNAISEWISSLFGKKNFFTRLKSIAGKLKDFSTILNRS